MGYESWLERDQVMWLDWDQAVTGIASQPFRLTVAEPHVELLHQRLKPLPPSDDTRGAYLF